MQPLDRTLRHELQATVEKARDTAEAAARTALTQLGVGEAEALRLPERSRARPAPPPARAWSAVGRRAQSVGRAGGGSAAGRSGLRALAPHVVRPLSRREQPADVSRSAASRAGDAGGVRRTRARRRRRRTAGNWQRALPRRCCRRSSGRTPPCWN